MSRADFWPSIPLLSVLPLEMCPQSMAMGWTCSSGNPVEGGGIGNRALGFPILNRSSSKTGAGSRCSLLQDLMYFSLL